MAGVMILGATMWSLRVDYCQSDACLRAPGVNGFVCVQRDVCVSGVEKWVVDPAGAVDASSDRSSLSPVVTVSRGVLLCACWTGHT